MLSLVLVLSIAAADLSSPDAITAVYLYDLKADELIALINAVDRFRGPSAGSEERQALLEHTRYEALSRLGFKLDSKKLSATQKSFLEAHAKEISFDNTIAFPIAAYQWSIWERFKSTAAAPTLAEDAAKSRVPVPADISGYEQAVAKLEGTMGRFIAAYPRAPEVFDVLRQGVASAEPLADIKAGTTLSAPLIERMKALEALVTKTPESWQRQRLLAILVQAQNPPLEPSENVVIKRKTKIRKAPKGAVMKTLNRGAIVTRQRDADGAYVTKNTGGTTMCQVKLDARHSGWAECYELRTTFETGHADEAILEALDERYPSIAELPDALFMFGMYDRLQKKKDRPVELQAEFVRLRLAYLDTAIHAMERSESEHVGEEGVNDLPDDVLASYEAFRTKHAAEMRQAPYVEDRGLLASVAWSAWENYRDTSRGPMIARVALGAKPDPAEGPLAKLAEVETHGARFIAAYPNDAETIRALGGLVTPLANLKVPDDKDLLTDAVNRIEKLIAIARAARDCAARDGAVAGLTKLRTQLQAQRDALK